MKWWVRLQFCLNGIEVRFREFWMCVGLLSVVLLVTALLFLMNELNRNLQDGLNRSFQESFSRVGYFSLDDISITPEEEREFAEMVAATNSIKSVGSWGYYVCTIQELQFLTDIQGKHRFQAEWGEEEDYLEGINIYEGTWDLLQLELAEGAPPQNYNLDEYVPIYLGYQYRGTVEVGTVIKSENVNAKDYIIAGIFKKGLQFPTDTLYLMDKFTVFSSCPMDYAVVEVVKNLPSSPIFFDLKEQAVFEDARTELQKLAKEKEWEITVSSLDAQMDLIDESLKPVQKYMLEIMVIVGLTVCIVVTCYQTVSIINRKSEYGILYANGATSRDLFSIIVLENLIKLLVAFIIMLPLLLLAARQVFGYNEANYIVVRQMLWAKVAWKAGIVGGIIMLVSSILPLYTMKSYTPVTLIGGNDI